MTALLGFGWVGTSPNAAGDLVGSGSSPSPMTSLPKASAFTISGNAVGIYPGSDVPLRLTILNHESFSIAVVGITTSTSDTVAACRDTLVRVTSFEGHVVVLKKGTSHISVHVQMSHSAPNACQKVHFVLHFKGTAVRA
jgi:hypothetical protein